MRHKCSFLSLLGIFCVAAPVQAQTNRKVNALDYHPAQHAGSSARQLPPSFASPAEPLASQALGAVRPEETPKPRANSVSRVMGFERHIGADVAQNGLWRSIDAERSVYQVAIRSNGAAAVRVHFSNFKVGQGRVWVYSADRAEVHGPYTGANAGANGDFWGPTVRADTAVIEYEPKTAGRKVPFDVSGIGHVTALDDSGVSVTTSCENDVSCYAAWSPFASGVGMIHFVDSTGVMDQCTGALVNNANNDYKPYFLTAGHCIPDQATAQPVEVVWQYQTGSCDGAQPDPSTLPATLGATFLAANNPYSSAAAIGAATDDFSLIELSSLPNMSLVFYGWSADPNALQVGDPVVAVHHPDSEVKRISFGTRVPDAPGAGWVPGVPTPPVTNFYEIAFTGSTAGRIEEGSTGSPLLTPDRTIVATMSALPYSFNYRDEVCLIDPLVVQYSKLSLASSALTKYLGNGAADLAPAAPSGASASGAAVSASPSSLSMYWVLANPSQTAPVFVQVTTTSSAPVTVSAGSNQPWISISAPSFTVSQAAPYLLQVTLNPSGITAGGNFTGAVTLNAGGVQTAINVSLDADAVGFTPSLDANVSVFPLFEAGPGFTSSFTLSNSYSSATTAYLSFNNLDASPLVVQPDQYYTPTPIPTFPGIPSTATPAQGFPTTFLESQMPAGSQTVFGTAAVAPLRAGMALAWTEDTQKQLTASLTINGNAIPAATPVELPFGVPFDASTAGSTQLFLYNNAWGGSAALTVSGYDATGALIGINYLTIPARQAASLVLTSATDLFGGKKGTLVITGEGTFLAAGLQISAAGVITSMPPMQPSQQ